MGRQRSSPLELRWVVPQPRVAAGSPPARAPRSRARLSSAASCGGYQITYSIDGPVREVRGERDARIRVAGRSAPMLKKPGREVRMALRQAPLLLELLEPADDVDRLLERVHPDCVARPAGPDRRAGGSAVRRLPLDDDPQDPDAGGHRRHGQRTRVRGRLGDDRAVRAEARPRCTPSCRAGAPSSPRRRPSAAGAPPPARMPSSASAWATAHIAAAELFMSVEPRP